MWSTLVELPFTFTYYGATYDQITVCSNGWIAFGDQSWNDSFRNFPMPGINSASNMVAVYWDDLKTAQLGQGVWSCFDSGQGRFVVQWKASGGLTSYNEADLDFEVVLFDTAMHPTRDGNGRILFQYNDVTMGLSPTENPGEFGCTIGIQNSGSVIGLQYVYGSSSSGGASSIVDGSAILYTTNGPLPLDTATVAQPAPMLPQSMSLHPNYPNPFNPATTLSFDIASAGHATLFVYDVTGRTVARLLDGVVEAGTHRIEFDGKSLSSGVYFYRLQAGAEVQTRKMVLSK